MKSRRAKIGTAPYNQSHWLRRSILRVGAAWITGGLILGFSLGCSKSPAVNFERQNKLGLNQNPKGLRVELTTWNGKREFHLSEPVPLKLNFLSLEAGKYTIEMQEGSNSASLSERYQIFPADSVYYDNRLRAFACCHSKQQSLSSEPVSIILSQTVRFLKSGDYELYATSNRIFLAEQEREAKTDNVDGPTVISTIARLRIAPDDPQWLSEQLANIITALNGPSTATMPDPCTALSWLEEKLRRIESSQPCGDPTSIAESVHPDVIIPRLLKLIHDPRFPVTQALVESLGTLSALKDHPELAPSKAPFSVERYFRLRDRVEAAERAYLPEIRAAAKIKMGAARTETLLTLVLLGEPELNHSRNSRNGNRLIRY